MLGCRTSLLWVVVGMLGPIDLAGAEDSESRITFEKAVESIAVVVDGQRVATYRYRDAEIPRPFLCDVRSAQGVPVTRHHPPIAGVDRMDHPDMHPGIWLAFGDLSGTDFWRNSGRVVFQGFNQEPQGQGDSGSMEMRYDYRSRAGDSLCQETCRLTFRPGRWGYWILWDSQFSSERAITFGDQEEMGLGVRLATPIAVADRQGGRILDSLGRLNGSEVWGKTAAWCDYSGIVSNQFVGLMVIPHPENFAACRWHARDYGFMAANPFGRAVFNAGPPNETRIAADAGLRLQFAILVHGNESAQAFSPAEAYEECKAMWQTFGDNSQE